MTAASKWVERPAITPRAPSDQAATGDRFLVLIEGTQTEHRYLNDLCGKLRLTADNVVIDSPDSDPLNLVDIAITRRNRRLEEAEEMTSVGYDQVWVVCDRERAHHHRIPRLREAIIRAHAEGIHIALSTPCFEYWLLLHHRLHHAALADCPAVEAELSIAQLALGYPEYDKALYPLDFYVARARVADACRRARQIRDYHSTADSLKPPRYWTFEYIVRQSGADSGNPSTDVDELIRQLNLAANPRRRFVNYPNLHPIPFTRQ